MKLYVDDMSCNHCVMKIQKALLTSGIQAVITLEDKTVNLKAEKDVDKAIEAIKKAGYEARR